MDDERAKRAAMKAWVAGDFLDSGGGFLYSEADVEETASIIASEYADVLAENERLKALVTEAREIIEDLSDLSAHPSSADKRARAFLRTGSP